jgi:ubiquinone biosynthesis protein Coq4
MQLLFLQPAPSLRKRTAEFIIETLKIGLTVKPLQLLHGKNHFATELEEFKKLPAGTIGHAYAALLNEYNLKAIPRHENHDLWHVLLGYGMTSEEEIRMQAFMYGNGSRSVYCHLFLLSGLLLPGSWKLFYADYLKGKATKCILALDIRDCCNESTYAIRQHYGIEV